MDKKRAPLYIGLVHYPVYNKRMEIINTSITNLDLHDLARVAASYELDGYFVIQPLPGQVEIARRIIKYWQSGQGARYNPDRQRAFTTIHLVSSVAEAEEKIREKEGTRPRVVVTDARLYPNSIGYRELRKQLEEEVNPYLILFGTGWGLAEEIMLKADYILEPIYGVGNYNHLSVRSAVSIIIDRLCGEKWWK
ncbi:RNA methyltransferase [Calderihabitans maritimus]|uniref:tRNA (Guanine-N1)-methyltransferase n=1 Tax=Calderihabitans maritimus TaxID=1246530 RepID=A0A1Z5HTT2_9FIRM|nr:RNA methyltransferase [Calderihabitans maritimus]GAW92828.1 tRNA (Guanine-N1)-methyltransferase [Calderihabitans maritimus]